MTPKQVAALEQWARENEWHACNMQKVPSILALCAAWREGQGALLRSLSDRLSGGNAATWDHIEHAIEQLQAERDATLAQLDALRDAICPEWQTKGLASVLTGLAAAHRSDSETMDEIGDGFDVSYRQAVEQRNAALARCRHLENEANGRQCPTCAGPLTVDGCAECATALARAEAAERERDEARKQRPKLVTLDRWSDAVVTALEADRSKAEATIATLRAEVEREQIRLAACGCAAMSNTPESAARQRIGNDNPYWSASYSDVCAAVDREMALRAALTAAQEAETLLSDVLHNQCGPSLAPPPVFIRIHADEAYSLVAKLRAALAQAAPAQGGEQ